MSEHYEGDENLHLAKLTKEELLEVLIGDCQELEYELFLKNEIIRHLKESMKTDE